MRAENKSPPTIQSYFLAADQLIAYLHKNGQSSIASEVSHREIQDYLAHMFETRASATAKQRYASLQQLFKWLVLEEEIETNPFDKVRKPKVTKQPVPIITADDRTSLLDACKGKDFESLRDIAVVRTLSNTGVRLGELVGMELGDVHLERAEVTVTGKGDKTRTVALGDNTIVALDRYQRKRRSHRLSHLTAHLAGPPRSTDQLRSRSDPHKEIGGRWARAASPASVQAYLRP